MKKFLAGILALAMAGSLMACGASEAENVAGGNDTGTSSTTATDAADTETSNTSAADGDADRAKVSADDNILIVYFSSANTASVDTVSSATPTTDGVGAVGVLAADIHNTVGGTLSKITPVTDYPESYDGTADKAKDEQDKNERPAFTLENDLNPEDYDTIFVGYPIWWYHLPMIMDTFFETYDFSGKTIIPFNTHEGSGDGGTYEEIKALQPNATVLDGLAVRGGSVDDAESDVSDWLAGLGF